MRRQLDISFIRKRKRLGKLARGQNLSPLPQYEMIQGIQIFRFQLREHRRRVRASVVDIEKIQKITTDVIYVSCPRVRRV